MGANAADLTTLATVKLYQQIEPDNEPLVQVLITSISQHILLRTGRRVLNRTATLTDTYDGSGGDKQLLNDFPVQSVTSVTVFGQSVPPSTDGITAGWINDPYSLVLLPGTTLGGPLSLYAVRGRFPKGRQNVKVTYVAGYSSVGGPGPFPPGDPAYNNAPSDLGQAVTEFVAQQYRKRDWVDQAQKTLTQTGESVRFRDWEIPPFLARVIDSYKRQWLP